MEEREDNGETTSRLIKPQVVVETPRILMEKQGLLGDEGHQPIKKHPGIAGYHGN